MKNRMVAASLVLVALLTLAGCGPRTQVTGMAGLEKMMRTELYFGLSMPDGKTVSEAEWAAFVDEQITPRFKEGLTIFEARGQYLDKKKVVKERTKVVVIVHPDTPKSRIHIYNIIGAYKQEFDQEAVLRVTHRVGVTF